MSFLVNYNRIINDENLHLWMKMAKDNDVLVNFKNEDARDKWIKKIEDDVRKFGTKEEFLSNLLKLFESLHWIDIEDKKKLKFRFKLPKERFDYERQFILEFLSKYSKVSQYNEVFKLEGIDDE